MSYEINCPFCEEKITSDVIDSINHVKGQWQCSNGHTFLLEYIETIEQSNKVWLETDEGSVMIDEDHFIKKDKNNTKN